MNLDPHNPARTEADALIETARKSVDVKLLDDTGIYYDGHASKVVDIRHLIAADRQHPARKTGTYHVKDADSFVEYVRKHGLDESELWASSGSSELTAVIDAHGLTHAGWQEHEAVLKLQTDPDWHDFTRRSGTMMSQVDFAEFIEDHLHCFVKPVSAEMLELAQTFVATTKVDFESSKRVKSGETQVHYAEHTTAGAGTKGNLVIPDTFTVGLTPYKGYEPYAVEARFRYRIQGQALTLGYKLVRPDKVIEDAFNGIVTDIGAELDRAILRN